MTIDLKHITVAFDYASGDIADIKRCLECLYQTAEGTCPLDREFGLNTDFVGMPMDVARASSQWRSSTRRTGTSQGQQ